jgi:hypothetical protein
MNVCNVITKDGSSRIATIDEKVAKRAYNRIVVDPLGKDRVHDLNLGERTKNFPHTLKKAINDYGFIDDWASTVQFNATLPCIVSKKRKSTKAVAQEESPHKETKKPTVSIKQFAYRDEHDDDKVFWFLSINEAFTDPFWNEWVSAIDTMRFCIGLGGKKKRIHTMLVS